MIFEHDRLRYDTSDMEVFELPAMHQALQPGGMGDCTVLAVYLTRGNPRKQVFVLTADARQGVNIHRADEAETRRLAAEYLLPKLLEALPQP